jgi:hypothetical protein
MKPMRDRYRRARSLCASLNHPRRGAPRAAGAELNKLNPQAEYGIMYFY